MQCLKLLPVLKTATTEALDSQKALQLVSEVALIAFMH